MQGSGLLRGGLFFIVGLLILGGLGCASGASRGLRAEPSGRGLIKVGLVAPFSGRHRATGYEALFAVRLALREWNARGGVEGYRVLLVAQDGRGRAEEGRLQAEKLVADGDVLGVVGHPGAASLSGAAPVYADAKMAMLSWGVASFGGEEAATLVRLGPSPTAAAEGVANFAADHLEARRVAVVAGSGDEDESLAAAVTKAYKAKGLALVLQSRLPQGGADYGELMAELERTSPEVVFFSGGFAEAASLLSQARRAGMGASFVLGFESANADLVRLAGKAAEGVYYLSPGRDPKDIAGASGFREAYQGLSGAAPGATAVLAYDATNLLLETAAASLASGGGPDRKAISQGLASFDGYEGVSGPLASGFSKGGRGVRTYIYRIEGLSYPGLLVYPP